ncbi:MAG: DUF3617 domain-containing protein [Burkholderiales bacterium]|nr:DUF3617 domain-containing protein [Burkholderiales bacterium]
MKSLHRTSLLAMTLGVASLSSVPALAETIALKLRPGLWEETRSTLINGKNLEEIMQKQMEKSMSRLTPEQRAQMQKSGRMGGGTAQSCLSAAQVAKGINVDEIRQKMQAASRGCSLNIISADASGAKFNTTCMGPGGGDYKGLGEYKVSNDKEWSFKMVGDGSMKGVPAAAGQNGNFHVTQEVHAHWKSADCGSVAPTE